MPAIERYTGVLYDALDVRSLTRAQRRRAGGRLAVGSALFGLLRAEDPVPAYRLSAGSSLPGLPSLRSLWKPVLTDVLAGVDDLVVELRSGAYAELAPVPGAVTVQVLSERPDGTRAVVAGQVVEGVLGQLSLAADPVHDLEPSLLRLRDVGDEVEEVVRLPVQPESLECRQRSNGVANPGVAVVPVAHAPWGFGQRCGCGRHDSTRRAEG